MAPGPEASRLIFAGMPGPEVDRATEAALRDLEPAGVILFDRNLRSLTQVRELTTAVREVVGRPLFIAIDEEGGRVNRMRRVHEAFTRLPEARAQATWGEERLELAWEAVGNVLHACGLDLTFAPVVDLDESEGANAIGARSFGTDPGRVAALAARVVAGLSKARIAACVKHFPGLGGTDLDTHKGLATSPHTKGVLWSDHVRPYRELRESASFVMTAHAHFPAINGPEPLPGTFSARLVGEWLREGVGWEGVIITDDLEMGAVRAFGTAGERALRALRAGCDVALFCHGLDEPRHARDSVARALERGDLDAGAAFDSHRRLENVRARFHAPAVEPIRIAEAEARITALEEILRA